jgi:hypothetical protein
LDFLLLLGFPVLLTKHHAVKAYWGHAFFDLGTMWKWVVSFTPQPLCPQGKSPWYPINRRLGGPQSRSGRGGEEKNSHLPPGLEPPIIQPVAQRNTTELSRVIYVNTTFRKLDLLPSSGVPEMGNLL